MNTKDRLLLMLSSLAFGWFILHANPTVISPASSKSESHIGAIRANNAPNNMHDTVVSVKGKRVLFIGDSHTAFDHGWQHQVATKTGMSYLNTAVVGKQTGWMLETAKQNIHSGFDYCFIYGGANDMAGNRPPIKSVKNIQKIVDLCLRKQVIPIVITGFDPITCINIGNRKIYKGYPQRYAKFQQMLIDSIHGAKVIKTHCISRTDCGDFLCHMTSSGHKKMAEKVIKDLALQRI